MGEKYSIWFWWTHPRRGIIVGIYIVLFNIENLLSHLRGGCEIEWMFYFENI